MYHFGRLYNMDPNCEECAVFLYDYAAVENNFTLGLNKAPILSFRLSQFLVFLQSSVEIFSSVC